MGTALRHGTWMDEESFKKTCIKEKEKLGGTHQPFYGTWVAAFMLKQDAGRFMLGKSLSDKKSMEAEQTIGDGGGITASFLINKGRMQSDDQQGVGCAE